MYCDWKGCRRQGCIAIQPGILWQEIRLPVSQDRQLCRETALGPGWAGAGRVAGRAAERAGCERSAQAGVRGRACLGARTGAAGSWVPRRAGAGRSRRPRQASGSRRRCAERAGHAVGARGAQDVIARGARRAGAGRAA